MIQSKDNRHLKSFRQAQRKKGREETGYFPAEGARLIGDLLLAGLPPALLLHDAAKEVPAEWLERFPAVYAVDGPLLEKALETDHSQGYGALFRQKRWDLPAFLSSGPGFVFILSGVQDPGNLGTMMRNAAAAAVDALFLSDNSADPYNPKAVRGSMGAIGRLPVFCGEAETLYDRLRKAGFCFYLADMAGDFPYWELPLDGPIAVVLGNEGSGPAPFWRRKADGSLFIPLAGGVESLNVGMAQGITAFDRLRRQAKPAGLPIGHPLAPLRPGDQSPHIPRVLFGPGPWLRPAPGGDAVLGGCAFSPGFVDGAGNRLCLALPSFCWRGFFKKEILWKNLLHLEMPKSICYNKAIASGGEVTCAISKDYYWRFFEETGSLIAYIFYRKMHIQ